MNTDKDQERTLWEQEDSEVEQEQETSQGNFQGIISTTGVILFLTGTLNVEQCH